MRSVFLSHLLPRSVGRSVVALEFLLTLYCARERRERRRDGVKYAVALKVVGHRAEEERAAAVVGGPALPREVGARVGRAMEPPVQKMKARKE